MTNETCVGILSIDHPLAQTKNDVFVTSALYWEYNFLVVKSYGQTYAWNTQNSDLCDFLLLCAD